MPRQVAIDGRQLADYMLEQKGVPSPLEIRELNRNTPGEILIEEVSEEDMEKRGAANKATNPMPPPARLLLGAGSNRRLSRGAGT